jgi:hypothetical protein
MYPEYEAKLSTSSPWSQGDRASNIGR